MNKKPINVLYWVISCLLVPISIHLMLYWINVKYDVINPYVLSIFDFLSMLMASILNFDTFYGDVLTSILYLFLLGFSIYYFKHSIRNSNKKMKWAFVLFTVINFVGFCLLVYSFVYFKDLQEPVYFRF